MKRLKRYIRSAPILGFIVALTQGVAAQVVAPEPPHLKFGITQNQARVVISPVPNAANYEILSTPDLNLPWNLDSSGTLQGFEWLAPLAPAPQQKFFRARAILMSSNAVLTATVLNRLAYGPTPDELDRVLTGDNPIGPQAFINEQLQPWNIVDDTSQMVPVIAVVELRMAGPEEVVTELHIPLSELVGWRALRAVNSRQQLLEILLQFLENHFVTNYEKSRTYLFDLYEDPNAAYCTYIERLATQFEYLEDRYWRAALMNPQCTFEELLTISAKSPAMIIYLDTIANGVDGPIANENYARELLELFSFGVDNGYDQSDIEAMSPAWMGWQADLVAPGDSTNPLATPLVGMGDSYTNHSGVWAMNYQSEFHHQTNSKTIFLGKQVPERFGPPWAGQSYQLDLPARTGTDGMQDGLDILQHVANQPFTMEYMSVKLCRLFVHDDFPNPSTRPELDGYHYYDYRRPDLTPEARLVHDCMVAWDSTSPKGQIWNVLETIFSSELFRNARTSQAKIKTPFEYVASAIRALRVSTDRSNNFGTFTSVTDGFSFEVPLVKMGNMLLFNRGEPDGYPEDGRTWTGAGTLTARVRFSQSFLLPSGFPGKSIAGVANLADPVMLLQSRMPPELLNDAGAVADYLLSIIYPGVGPANLAPYRQMLVDRLNDGSTDAPASNQLFADLPVSNTAGSGYDTRVRASAALLLSLQHFQEQ